MEKSEIIQTIKDRLEYLTDQQLQNILKGTHQPTVEELRADIEKASKYIK